METIEISMTLRIPRAASESEAKEALRLAESAFQTALGNSVDAEFDYDDAVADFVNDKEIMDDDEEELDDEMDDIDDEDFGDEEDEEEVLIRVVINREEDADELASLIGCDDRVVSNVAGRLCATFYMPIDADLLEVKSKLRASPLVVEITDCRVSPSKPQDEPKEI